MFSIIIHQSFANTPLFRLITPWIMEIMRRNMYHISRKGLVNIKNSFVLKKYTQLFRLLYKRGKNECFDIICLFDQSFTFTF